MAGIYVTKSFEGGIFSARPPGRFEATTVTTCVGGLSQTESNLEPTMRAADEVAPWDAVAPREEEQQPAKSLGRRIATWFGGKTAKESGTKVPSSQHLSAATRAASDPLAMMAMLGQGTSNTTPAIGSALSTAPAGTNSTEKRARAPVYGKLRVPKRSSSLGSTRMRNFSRPPVGLETVSEAERGLEGESEDGAEERVTSESDNKSDVESIKTVSTCLLFDSAQDLAASRRQLRRALRPERTTHWEFHERNRYSMGEDLLRRLTENRGAAFDRY